MAKISFSKVEDSFAQSLRKILIERLSELATIVTLIQDPRSKVPANVVEDIINKFHGELVTIKEKDVKLYEKLDLKPDEEAKFMGPMKNLSSEEWDQLKALKERIDVLKRELFGQDVPNTEYEKQVEEQRLKHINKRFNIRENWLPLH